MQYFFWYYLNTKACIFSNFNIGTVNAIQKEFVKLHKFILQFSFACNLAFYFNMEKKLWTHPSKRLLVILQDFFKTSWKTKHCYAEDVLKTSWRHVLKTSWRHCGGKQNTYWGYLYLTNLNVYLTNLYFTNQYLTILRRVQIALIRTQ